MLASFGSTRKVSFCQIQYEEVSSVSLIKKICLRPSNQVGDTPRVAAGVQYDNNK